MLSDHINESEEGSKFHSESESSNFPIFLVDSFNQAIDSAVSSSVKGKLKMDAELVKANVSQQSTVPGLGGNTFTGGQLGLCLRPEHSELVVGIVTKVTASWLALH